jgi:GNAT superfamily N-acetyltransferase
MKITIRLAKPDDALDIAEVQMRSWEVAYKDIIPMEYIKAKNATRHELYQRIITNENTTQHVIQVDDKTVGIMGIGEPKDDDVDDSYYELYVIYLHPDYFRKGIGTQAVNFAFEKARNLGKRFMNVWVLAENYNSINFYKKYGFVADGKTHTREYGKVMGSIRMRKELII